MNVTPDTQTVALYLEEHPNFFDDHPELIADLKLTTALGGRTVSLHERQVEVLRDKVRQLELKLVNQTRFAKDNDAIMEKFHRWVLKLLSVSGEQQPEILLEAIRACFDVPAASLRLWTSENVSGPWQEAADLQEAKALTHQQSAPYCGPPAGKPGVSWLDDAPTMQSVALVPLRLPGGTESFGLLVLGSPDPLRFSAELATDFLARIGETASAVLRT